MNARYGRAVVRQKAARAGVGLLLTVLWTVGLTGQHLAADWGPRLFPPPTATPTPTATATPTPTAIPTPGPPPPTPTLWWRLDYAVPTVPPREGK